MSETPHNLSGAIKRAREQHRADIEERLRRREQRERELLARLNDVRQEPVAHSSAAEPVVDIAEPARSLATVSPIKGTFQGEEASTTQPQPQARSVETLPADRFLKVRNAIFDELARFLTGNQYKIYMEIYRETLGRKHPTGSGYFRTRDLARDLGIGSDQTVYRALRQLDERGLLSLEARVGDTRGTRITVQALDRALESLKTNTSSAKRRSNPKNTVVKITEVDQQKTLQYRSENHHARSVKITTLHDHVIQKTHETPPTTQRDGGEYARKELLSELASKYAFSPKRASAVLSDISDEDLSLVPFLLQRLDKAIKLGHHRKGAVVQNPAGLLTDWLSDFASWKEVLIADRNATTTQTRHENQVAEDLYTDYLTAMDSQAEDWFVALDPSETERLTDASQRQILEQFPAARDWPPDHWKRVVHAHIKRAHFQRPSFDEWLASRE